MTVSAFATAVVATAITAAVASATATTFATHHFHQFLDFFVSSRTASTTTASGLISTTLAFTR